MGNVVAIKRLSERSSVSVSVEETFFARALSYPELCYMGSKKRLLPWIAQVLNTLDFESALDPFSGTGSVGYLIKAMDGYITRIYTLASSAQLVADLATLKTEMGIV